MRGGALAADREAKLQELVDEGKLQWDSKNAETVKWDTMYSLLVDYGRRHGTCQVPCGWKEKIPGTDSEVKLGKWLENQLNRFMLLSKSRRERFHTLANLGLLELRGVVRSNEFKCENHNNIYLL